MTGELHVVGSRQWRFHPDGPQSRAEFPQALVEARVVDELTGRAPPVPLRVVALTPELSARTHADGIVGLVGRPAPTFGALLPSTLAFRIEAPGYVPRTVELPLGPQPLYPDLFDRLSAGEVALHRQGVALNGRVIRRAPGTAPQPLAGADVAVSAYWASFADLVAGLPAAPAAIIAIDPPLSAPRAAGATVRQQQVVLAGPAKTLSAPANPGEATILLSDTVGLAAGSVLAVQPGDPDRAEYVAINAIAPVASQFQAAEITLDHPLARPHPMAATVQRASLPAPGPAHTFDRDAIAGDTSLFLTSVAGFSADTVVSLEGGAPTEYRRARLLEATSDADGDFRLPPLARVATVQLAASSLPLPSVSQDHAPAYARAEERIEVTFP